MTGGNGDLGDIELADAVQAVRDGLLEAAARGTGNPLGFVVGPIHMEFSVEIRREKGRSGGVKAWVASGDIQRTDGRTTLHRVQFELTPKDLRTDGDFLVGTDQRADVSGFFGEPDGAEEGNADVRRGEAGGRD